MTVPAPSNVPSSTPGKFISGKVVTDDGTPLTDQAIVQSICRGQRHAETHTDFSGNFSFEFGKQRNNSDDAESSSMGSFQTVSRSGKVTTSNDRFSSDCQLIAVEPGFSSDTVELSSHQDEQLTTINVGSIVLHRVKNVEGLTISATTAAAPADARKAYEKGREDESKGKLEDAQKKFEKAVSVYPNFAVAWVELGRLQAHFKNLDQARQSFSRATAADPKLVTPYQQVAQIAFEQRHWEEVVNATDQVLQLNPLSFPQEWFYNAVGNFYLNRLDRAEKSARETLKTDLGHHFAKADYLLGMVLMQKKDFAGAVEHFRSYLAHLATPSEAASVQAELATAERLSQAQVTQGQARP
jgi:tetratricopeptide (TPR) repeat protein